MGFRDDHDAALARAKALERELRDAEGAREAAETALETREQELEATRAELERLRAQVPTETRPKPSRLPNPDPEPDEHPQLELRRIKLTPLQKRHHKTDEDYSYVPIEEPQRSWSPRQEQERARRSAIIALGVTIILGLLALVVIIASAR